MSEEFPPDYYGTPPPRPEPPDFEKLARTIVEQSTTDGTVLHDGWNLWVTGQIAEQLRQVWNARGAADIAKLETAVDPSGSLPSMKTLDRALRTLDR